jgi:hypothetical protein
VTATGWLLVFHKKQLVNQLKGLISTEMPWLFANIYTSNRLNEETNKNTPNYQCPLIHINKADIVHFYSATDTSMVLLLRFLI